VNLAAVSLLAAHRETRTWYRVVGTRYVASAIATGHTVVVPSRFYDPTTAYPQFASLYVSDSALVAMFEAQALFGSPTTPGGTVSPPAGSWTVVTVRLQLDAVVDLSDVASQALLDVSVQELSGDWRGYRQRSAATNVPNPTGTAPTQALGEAIHRDPRDLEGLLTVSAKVPYNRNLVVFPDRLRTTSYIEYEWQDGSVTHAFRIDQSDPNGRQTR
jgi:RES domain-containing protein